MIKLFYKQNNLLLIFKFAINFKSHKMGHMMKPCEDASIYSFFFVKY